MERYFLAGKLYLPNLSMPLDFKGRFNRDQRGIIRGEMNYDKIFTDVRKQIFGCLENEDELKMPHWDRKGENHLVLFHTRNNLPTNRTYWLGKSAQDTFEGKYTGIMKCESSYFNIEDILSCFGWRFSVEQLNSEENGIPAEINLIRTS